MEIINKQMPDSFNEFQIGDTHIGSAAFSQNALECFIDKINSGYAGLPASKNYFVFGGDAIEGITIDDKRFDPMDVPKILFPHAQIVEVIKLFKPIAKKCIVWQLGNHEWALKRFVNAGEYIAKELNVPYGTFACKIIYIDKKGNTMFKHFRTHGKKGINSVVPDPKKRREAMENMLKRHLSLLAGDCAIASKAHAHKVLVCRPEPSLYLGEDEWGYLRQKYSSIETPNGSEHITPDRQWFTCSGSFLRTYVLGRATYGERNEYPMSELGCTVMRVRERQIAGIDKLIFDC